MPDDKAKDILGKVLLLVLGVVLGYVIFRIASGYSYSNIEEWEIVRDPETGRVRGVRVHREAKG
jgi:hypothetical protein